MVYLNNFPSQNAIKGQEFKGSKELESELFNRGVIGDGEITIVNVSADSNEKVEALEKEKTELEKKLKTVTDSLAKTKKAGEEA
jgi:hypothetical protein